MNPYTKYNYKQHRRPRIQLSQSSKSKVIEEQQQIDNHNPRSTPLSYGNYPTYYSYRHSNTRIDPRLVYFEREWFYQKKILDIGCNGGWVDIQILQLFSPCSITAVDIDPLLIRKAKYNLQKTLSLCKESEWDYFPESCTPFGLLQNASSCLEFRVGDWLHEPFKKEVQYDLILALSITKWIHMRNGDAELKLFFKKCFDSLLPNGKLILEPQPIETYKSRSKFKLIPSEFPSFLIETIGFSHFVELNSSEEKKGFVRSLYLFVK